MQPLTPCECGEEQTLHHIIQKCNINKTAREESGITNFNYPDLIQTEEGLQALQQFIIKATIEI